MPNWAPASAMIVASSDEPLRPKVTIIQRTDFPVASFKAFILALNRNLIGLQKMTATF
jgi:hypothetical protein